MCETNLCAWNSMGACWWTARSPPPSRTVYDESALEAINSLAERADKLGERPHLRHLSEECRRMLDRTGDLVEANISDDPNYHVLAERSR